MENKSIDEDSQIVLAISFGVIIINSIFIVSVLFKTFCCSSVAIRLPEAKARNLPTQLAESLHSTNRLDHIIIQARLTDSESD